MATVRLSKIKTGMTLEEDIKNFSGNLILPKGTSLNQTHIKNLKAWGVYEATILDKNVKSEPIPKLRDIDPKLYKAAKSEAEELFHHSNTDHPAVHELRELCALNKLKGKLKEESKNGR